MSNLPALLVVDKNISTSQIVVQSLNYDANNYIYRITVHFIFTFRNKSTPISKIKQVLGKMVPREIPKTEIAWDLYGELIWEVLRLKA